MTTPYNPNDFYPSAGKEINSQGNVVNPADGVDSNGNQGVNTNGRKTNYQRVAVNQALAANGTSTPVVINTGLGTKAIQAGWKATGAVQVLFYGCDTNGNPLASGGSISTSSSTAQASLVCAEWGGAPYVAIVIAEKSGAANTVQFVDVWWTMD